MAEVKKTEKKKPIHLSTIPKKYFPRKTKSKEYLIDVLRISNNLRFVNTKVQYSVQICSYNLKSIIGKNHIIPKKDDIFREIKEFVYHYENYCFRLHAYREKILQLINAILPVGV